MVRESKAPTSFKVARTIESIFSGGPLLALKHGERDAMVMNAGDGIHIRDLMTGQSIKKFSLNMQEDESRESAVFTLSSSRLLVSHREGLVESWDIEEGRLMRSWKSHGSPITCMHHHPTSPLLATGFADHSVRVWDSSQGYCTHNLKGVHGAVVSAVLFSPDPAKMELFSAAEDGSIARWDLQQGKLTKSFRSHVSSVRSLDVSPDGRYLLSAGRDQVINIWNLSEGGKLERSIPCLEAAESVRFVSPTAFVSAGARGILRLWDLSSGACLRQSPKITTGEHGIVSTALLDRWLVVATSDLHIAVVDVDTLRIVSNIPGNLGEVTDLLFLQDKSLVIASNDADLRILSSLDSLNCVCLKGHQESVLSVAAFEDWLLSGSRDNTVCLWRRANGVFSLVARLSGHTDSVSAVAFSPKSQPPFFASAGADSTIKLWDIVGSESAGYQVVARWTVKGHEKDINSLAISPNEKLLISGSQDKTAKIWRVEDGASVGVLKGHKRGVWSVQCSPFEQIIATASGDHTVKLWSAITFDCLKTFEGHANSVLRVLFGGSSHEILSSGSDGLVKVWDIKSSECVQTFDEHLDRIWTLAGYNCGELLATGDASGVIKIWQNCTDEVLQLTKQSQEKMLQMEQDLSNLLLRNDFQNAILLSIELEQPYRLFSLLNNLLKGNTNHEALAKLHSLFSPLPFDKLDKICIYIRDWNVSFKRAILAQLVLFAILRLDSPERLAQQMPSLKETAKILLPYTERHFSHTQELMTSTYLVDFILGQMKGYLA